MKYLKVFTDFIDQIEVFGEAERGRLFTAMLEYARTGEEPELKGNERFIWGSVKCTIDRDRDTYDRMAGRARSVAEKRAASSEERPRNDLVQPRNDVVQKNNDVVQDKDKDKDKIVTRTREGTTNDDLQAIADALNAAFDAAAGIGLTGSTAIDKANLLAADYSAEWLLEAIRRASQAPRDAWCWRYIEGILRNWKQKGGIDSEKAAESTKETAKPKKQKYTYVKGGKEYTYEREVAG